MPELPEVETVRNVLKTQILNCQIQKIDIYYDRMITPDVQTFKNALLKQTFRDILRMGKYLIFILDDVSIVGHLRMEGKYFIKKDEEVQKHEHVVFHLCNLTTSEEFTLRYHDVRKFGTLSLVKTTDLSLIKELSEVGKLGLDANDPNLTKEDLFEKLKNKRIPLKTALLDQTIIAGLGNIYVDEVCFLANLHPQKLASTLTLTDCEKIIKNSQKVLAGAIKAGGTTIRSYTSSLGVTGLFQLKLHVHTRVGEPCENCGTIIRKIVVGGRGTYYCRHCQPKEPYLIGLTGGIATGKSSVLKYLKENYQDNNYFIDCDEITHQLLQTNPIMLKIAETFGSEYLDENGVIRSKLGKLIFNDNQKRELLNQIIHPFVKREIIKEIATNFTKKIIFIDIPLLFETQMTDLVDEIWCIVTSKEVQLQRLMKRDNIEEAFAKQKIRSQMDIEQKQKLALQLEKKNHNVYLIDNSTDIMKTYHQIDELIKF